MIGPFGLLLLAAQLPVGSLAGQVRDAQTGMPLAGAVVLMPDLGRGTLTGDDGRYVLLHVPTGPHHLEVRAIGYAPRSLHAIVPRTGTLNIATVLRALPVTLAEHTINAPRSDALASGTLFNRESRRAALAHHPLIAEADMLLALGGGEIQARPESPAGLSVRGGSTDQTSYVLDGMPVISPYHAGGTFSGLNPDAIGSGRVALTPAATSQTLAGTVELETRPPGDRVRTAGAISTNQARLTVDGPLTGGGHSLLVSGRSTFPGIFAPRHEPTYVHGTSDDELARLRVPLIGGQLQLTGYRLGNHVSAAARVPPEDSTPVDPPRHDFQWRSTSLGLHWQRLTPRTSVTAALWRAAGSATALWADSAPAQLWSSRRDLGLRLAATATGGTARSSAGVTIEHVRTRYDALTASSARYVDNAAARLITATMQHGRRTGPFELTAGIRLPVFRGRWRAAPSLSAQWDVSPVVSVVAGYARLYQFTQSLRNPEALASTVFPADLHVLAAPGTVPVADADQVVVAADVRPAGGIRFGLQSWHRASRGLVLVAVTESLPFATANPLTGSGTARGAALSAEAGGARFMALLRYVVQDVQLRQAAAGYRPEHAVGQQIDAGITVFPTATTAARVAVSAGFGRRGAASGGALEWESCSLLDQGCEFAGSPSTGTPGTARLPAYARLDVGVRQHWHMRLAGRDVSPAVFATLTNVLGRTNVLALIDPADGSTRAPVELRARGPLVVGLDWQF